MSYDAIFSQWVWNILAEYNRLVKYRPTLEHTISRQIPVCFTSEGANKKRFAICILLPSSCCYSVTCYSRSSNTFIHARLICCMQGDKRKLLVCRFRIVLASGDFEGLLMAVGSLPPLQL